MARAREDLAATHEEILGLAMKAVVTSRLRGAKEREGRILVWQNTIHRIHHVHEPHMPLTSLGTLVRNPRIGIGLACLAGIGLIVALPHPSNAAYPPSADGASIAASTDQAEATRAAIEAMSSGGNAVDGAIAAALTLGVVNPSASGIGGGGFALVYTAKDKKVTVLDFRENAPAVYSNDVLWPPVKPGQEPPKNRFTWTGPKGGVVGVPGEPAGLEELSRRFAKRSLSDDAVHAVSLAQHGFVVGRHTADQVVNFKDRLKTVPNLASSFLPGGNPVPYASRVTRPELAATIARFGAQGKRFIYQGATAQKIVDAVKAAGGTMSMEDLADYQVKERAPLSRTIDGRTVYTMPAPSAGGLMLLETLTMYGASSQSMLAPMGFGSSGYLHHVAEAMRGAWSDRVRFASDPDIEKGIDAAYNAALDPAQLAARRAKIDPQKTHAPIEFKTRESGTSHLVTADAEGNVVSMTTTVNGPFGASIVAGDTGILLNNELDDFTAPEDVKAFALKDGGPNRPRPRARPVSSMTPTIVVENGVPILAAGGSGGPRIATEVTQAVLARLVFDLDPTACVSHPRIHTQGADLLADKEIPVDVREALKARGENVKEEAFNGSAAQMIAWKRVQGQPVRLLAASDPRKAGFAAAR
jgi:gamma-glutamyltranspeptidase/glutathione hydrolase